MSDLDDATALTADASRLRYLDVGGEWLAVRYHPSTRTPREAAVMICAPFGFDEICSYRPLRQWAAHLAAGGHASLRLSFPGVGDGSGGPRDPDRIGVWTRSIEVGADWLRSVSGAHSIVILGIGLGGLLAFSAGSAGAAVDGLALWATPPRGGDLVRQLRAFSRMESDAFFEEHDEPLAPTGEGLQAGGFALSRETLEALKSIDITSLPTPQLSLGVLVLSRDGAGAEKLVAAIGSHGIDVQQADGLGYGAMTSDPQFAALPHQALRHVDAWLAQTRLSSGERARPEKAPSAGDDELRLDDGFTERELSIQTSQGVMRGILGRRPGQPSRVCAVFLNAGGVRSVGPNRMWVEAARRWHARGVASLRLDVLGLGESDGATIAFPDFASLYTTPEPRAQVIAALDALQTAGVARRFLLVGLCAGSNWALHAGLDDERVVGMMLLNPTVIVWDDGIAAGRDLRRALADRSWRRIRKNATPQRLRAVLALLATIPGRGVRRLRASTGGPPTLETRVNAVLERLRGSDKRLLLVFSRREGLADDLERDGWLTTFAQWPNARVLRIPVNDHTFRPLAIQALVHRELDAELERALAGSEAEPPPRTVERVGEPTDG